MLRELIKTGNVKNAIIFCNRKRDVAVLHKSLVKHGFNAGALHGDMDQRARMASLDAFKTGEVDLIVCSDVAARGLDIPDVSHVFNFDVPIHAEDYVHRIGRTGRAGMTGEAISLMCDEERDDLAAIEKLLKIKLPVQEPGQFERERVSAPRGGSRRPEARPEGRSEGRPPSRRDEHRRDEHRPAPSRNAASSADPLFSKPYTPSSETTQAVAAPSTPGRGPKKQIAALFLPPAPAEKQDA